MTRIKRIVISIYIFFILYIHVTPKVSMGVLARVETVKKPWCVAKAERSEGQRDARGVEALVGV